MLEAYRARNESLDKCIVYRLTTNGLFAEWHDITMTMIYAWKKGRQFVLDSSHFLYGPEQGWCEFFEPFCRAAEDVDPAMITVKFEFNPKLPNNRNTQILRNHQPDRLQIGELQLQGFDFIHDFFKRMIFRINATCIPRVAAHLQRLSLPADYLAVQIRRGDKLGEDSYYPAALYLQHLGEDIDGSTIFVMSDDFGAVEEVRHLLKIDGLKTHIRTLAEPKERGFDISLMRSGKEFTAVSRTDARAMQDDSLEQHTVRLLAEMIAAANASRFVTTEISYLGTAIKALSRNPQQVYLLNPREIKGFTPPPLRPGRHILDSYRKVLLVRPHKDSGFFASVLAALNQVLYAEREGYLPVVHFDRDSFGHFYEPGLGEDIWSYYFKPVAGYSKEDIDTMLFDRNNRLGPDNVIQLNDAEIEQLCHFDTRSIFHHTLGWWREHFPFNLPIWYKQMRVMGHLAVCKYLGIHDTIWSEADEFWDKNLAGAVVLGLHIRGTDLSYAAPVLLETYLERIETLMQKGPFTHLFLVTDQQQYLDRLKFIFGDKLAYQPQLRSRDSRNPIVIQRQAPAELGRKILIDSMLLSRCKLVLRGASSTAEFSHYLRPRLASHHFNAGVRSYRGWDYTQPESAYREFPDAWTLANGPLAWTTPEIRTLR